MTQVSVNSAAFFALFEICKMSLKPRRFVHNSSAFIETDCLYFSVREPSDSLLKPKIFQKPRKKIWKRMTVIE